MHKKLITLRIDVETQMALDFLTEQAGEMTRTDIVSLCIKQVGDAVKNNMGLELSLDLEQLPSYQRTERRETIAKFKDAEYWVFNAKKRYCHMCGKNGCWVCNVCHSTNKGELVMFEKNDKKTYGWIRKKEGVK